ncbi:FUSC family protein [Nocardia sp. NPDC057227]|uniref:FUSC family protein n=1 Tax=Nocardia sp. NPDC057227 TaxID=3346056 RepID=UPI003633650E
MSEAEPVTSRAGRPALLVWEQRAALVAFIAALPAAVVAANDVRAGVALTLGVLPAAVIGVDPVRRRRTRLLAAGLLLGVPMMAGSLLARVPVLAVLGLFLLPVLAVRATAIPRFTALAGLTTTTLLPMIGIGLSYPDLGTAAGLTGLFVLGSVLAWLPALLIPERPEVERPEPRPIARTYGYLLGAVAALTAGLGFALHLDHIGWACAAALMVMRPDPQLQRWRTAGRFSSVLAGCAGAAALVALDAPPLLYAIVLPLSLAAAAATAASRFYLLPAFTTFYVITLLGYPDPGAAQSRVLERLGETALGLAVAATIGILLPALFARRPGLTV